jgi:hypothetical protein
MGSGHHPSSPASRGAHYALPGTHRRGGASAPQLGRASVCPPFPTWLPGGRPRVGHRYVGGVPPVAGKEAIEFGEAPFAHFAILSQARVARQGC